MVFPGDRPPHRSEAYERMAGPLSVRHHVHSALGGPVLALARWPSHLRARAGRLSAALLQFTAQGVASLDGYREGPDSAGGHARLQVVRQDRLLPDGRKGVDTLARRLRRTRGQSIVLRS